MAKAKKGRSNLIQIGIGVALILLVANAALFLTKTEPKPFQQVVSEKLAERSDLDPRRKAQLRVQLAVSDYMLNNNGEAPPNLNVLVPKYFDRIPVDPATGNAFSYEKTGKTFRVGAEGESTLQARTTDDAEGVQGGEALSASQQEALIASMDQGAETVAYVYDSTGKRDPFRPFDFTPEREGEDLTPLERLNLSQLRLTSVLLGFGRPRAIVETTTGKGFTVEKGTKIGQNSGEIVEILEDRLLILESETDFTGETKTRTVEMRLRTNDQSPVN